ncbi:ABC transporter permease [Bacteroidia bacterium]|nr:ABC transporter permease [Bacteroidia bacterium]GHT27584.1 ABC transporter permease [Bacteroidia bacterium]
MQQFIRNFNKQKVVGLLNISSLSLGIMVSIIVGLWTINELSFDNFHKDKAHIYRAVLHATLNGEPMKLGSTFRPMGQEAKDKFPQIKDMNRVWPSWSDLKVNEIYYPGVKAFIADENFFTFFSFPLKEGEAETVLSAPDKVVISETAALKYFEGKNPIGQSLNFNGKDFVVSGVMYDMPRNSSLQSDFVIPPYDWILKQAWGDNDVYVTFFNLQEGTDRSALAKDMTQLAYAGLEFFETVGARYELEPLTEMHFSEGFMGDSVLKGNKPMILVLAIVALVILIISCINFTNLFISTSFLRAKSVGIMKSQGAEKSSLIRAFYGETACYTAIAIAVGTFLAVLSLPLFNNFIGSELVIDFTSVQLYAFLIVLFVFTVLLAGTFPALYITKFNPIETLFGKFKGKNISIFQKSLIIVQFTASIALLIVVSFMQKQVNFMVTKDLGFDKENIIYVQGRADFSKDFEGLRDELLKYPFIADITRKNSLPTEWNQGWGISLPGSDETVIMEMNYIKPNYFEFMNMKIIDGENPFYLESNDSITPVVINESTQKLLGLPDSPINEIIVANGSQRMIVKGLMRNANIRSLRDQIDPQVYMKHPQDMNWGPLFFKYTGDPQQTIQVIRQKWEELEPNIPFEYHFLDDTYKELYTSETNVSKVLAYAMFITFIISIAGLFAMAFYVTQRRIKEIGLRKVNGATLKDLLLLLNKDFVVWVLISFLIASPVAYFSLQSWLNGFTVKTALSIWLFLLVGILAMAVALLTTSFQTWNVATMNPVKTLKTE